MRSIKKLKPFALLACLTALTFSCAEKKPSLRLLRSETLAFPSGSAAVVHASSLYVFGDDAPAEAVLDSNYHITDSLVHTAGIADRIPKSIKPDLEAATVVVTDTVSYLLGIGSYSTERRRRVLQVNLKTKALSWVSFEEMSGALPLSLQPNIEGACTVRGAVVLANRGHRANPVNHMLVADGAKRFVLKELTLPATTEFSGISGLEYIPEKDLLLFTASQEATASTTADGAIGESFLGGIKAFSKKMKEERLTTDFFLPLSSFDKRFAQQKVESVCVERVSGDSAVLHLVADNDNGKTVIFKVSLSGL